MKAGFKARIKSMLAHGILQIPVAENRIEGFLKKAESHSMAELLLDMNQLNMTRMQRALFNRCEDVQRTLLLQLVRSNADTQYGRAHDFSNIHSIEDYRSRVPISEWSAFEPYIDALKKGAPDILFHGITQYFARTTGTTGIVKLIPISVAEMTVRTVVGDIRNLERGIGCGRLAELISGKYRFFTMSGTLSIEKTEAGIPIGSISGMATKIDGSSGTTRGMLAIPAMLLNYFEEGEEYFHVAMRCALYYRNIAAAAGPNPKQMENMILYAKEHAEELIEEIRTGTSAFPLPDEVKAAMKDVLVPNPERAEELRALYERDRFIPRYYWPDLVAGFFWLSGSIGVYADALRPYLPENITFMDLGYTASEASITMTLEPETPASILLTYAGFFEFLPLDGGAPLLAHEVEVGKDYEILLTTYSGLYRYRIHDIIHVDGFRGDTPLIHFQMKAGDVANLVGEKLSGALLFETARDALADRFGVVALQVYPDPIDRRYVFYIEPDRAVEDDGSLSELVHQNMVKKIAMYCWARGMALGKPIVRLMPEGWGKRVQAEYARDKANYTQIKVPIVRNQPYTDV